MRELPAPLEPLEEDRRRLLTILDLLDGSVEPAVRADLASELVGCCARYEDVKDRVVYPALRATAADGLEIDRAEVEQRAMRDALSEIRGRTQHVKPAYVHGEDPEGFEEVLVGLVRAIRDHIDHEDKELLPILAGLDPQKSEELHSEVQRAVVHASSHPDPPHNRLGRAIVAAHEWVEREGNDESTPWHPGVDKLDDELARADADENEART